jgi:diaminopimelate epimerase
MHGTGNDYIYVNGFSEEIENPNEKAIRWSDRHKGIGADGLVIILPSGKADFRMRMFNADGSEAEMCGNASRCIGKYVYDNGLTKSKNMTLETLAGIRTLELFTDKNNLVEKVTVDMGAPVLDAEKIPVISELREVINKATVFSDRIGYNITCVSMGNPHTVIFTNEIDQLNLPQIGPIIETAPIFPDRTNTEFVETVSKERLKMRVWERGSGETMACGTGASAVVVAGVLNRLCNRKITVELSGGQLELNWKQSDNHVYLTGEAITVFEGII